MVRLIPQWHAVVLLGLLAWVGGTSAATVPSPEVQQIRVGSSNVYLVKTTPPLLIDSGGKEDLAALEKGLKAQGVALEDIKTVLLTHGHADHAGLAATIKRRSGALLVTGAADVVMTRAGHNDDIKPTSLMARILKRFAIDPSYEGFEADVQVEAPLDLQRFGMAGRAFQMPGHTPGSLVLLLDDGRAFVGDMMLGGWMGGALFADQAGEHYFHDDLARNRANIVELLKRPIHTFYLGHGGPVSRASVLQGFGLQDPLAPGVALPAVAAQK